MNFNFDWDFIQAGAPYVTISDTGLGFNAPSIAMLGNPDFIQAGFDSDAMVIGIRASDEADDKKVYRFRERVKNGWVRIGCKDFVKYLSELLGTSFSPSKRYIAKYDESRKILYIELYGKDVKSQNEDKEDTTA